ncbi:hypothetical protein B0T24DRAFT_137782 [Lasiosphaeria ovina]|uniref:FAD-binding domain-containing protein n=1 Tax=Lasiosphaeria ovina TaxID=92902 RepID=A0AAE0NCT5_9PEZI|nr:hypothetical protein B0T24DRAFT_137782 [Lasiosphaeria ovina]
MGLADIKTEEAETASPVPFRICIVGGGIGGLATALFLHYFCGRLGITVDVYEQATEYREHGAGMGLGVNATKLLHRIGLGEASNAISGTRDGIWFTIRRFDNSAEITTVSANDKGSVRYVAVSRADQLQIFLDAVKQRGAAKLHTTKRCKAVEDLGRVVRVKFEDGTSTDADLVIGCDGIHSAIRQQFIQDKAVYSGKVLYRGLVSMSELPQPWPLPSHAVMWVSPGKHLVAYPICANKTLNVVACVTKAEEDIPDLKESWINTCDRAEVEADFAEFDGLATKVISLLPARPSKWRINDRDPVPDWTFMGGKVALLGDAAHAMVPHQQAGAGQAVEDGYIIAKALTEYLLRSSSSNNNNNNNNNNQTSLRSWMELYQRVRLPRAQRVQETSRLAGDILQAQTPAMKSRAFDDNVPLLAEGVNSMMKWIFAEDVDVAFDKLKAEIVPPPPPPRKTWARRIAGWFCL